MILVDPLQRYPLTTRALRRANESMMWCHMVSTVDEAELHAFAASIGLRRAWAQLRPHASAAHYDLTPRRRAAAIAEGALEVSRRELVMRNYDRQVRLLTAHG